MPNKGPRGPHKPKASLETAVAAAVLKSRLEAPPPAPMWGPSVDDFYWQHQFLDDPWPLKAVLAPRRSAKSYGPGLEMARGAAEVPGWAGLYLTKTIGLAEEIMWEPILKRIDSRFDLGLDFNVSKHVVTGKGRLRLYGVDASPDEVKKTVGKPHDYVFIDECAMFQYDLEDLIDKYIQPSLIDRRGKLVLGSSPSDLTRGYFYELTKDLPDEPGMTVRTNSTGTWHVYRWTPRENPYVAENWERAHAEKLRANPLIVETPAYQQMWLGKWCVDDSNLVYKFKLSRDVIDELPRGRYECVLGIDLGFNDETALVVLAWSEFDQCAYVVHDEAASGMDFTAVSERVKALCRKWNIVAQVVDGANKQGVAEMNARLGLHLEASEKQGKYQYQKLLNADLTTGRLKLIGPATQGLQAEWQELIWWDEKRLLVPPKWVEHPRLPNHRADACLYAWRYTHTYLSSPRQPELSAKAQEKAKAIEAAVARRLARLSAMPGEAPDYAESASTTGVDEPFMQDAGHLGSMQDWGQDWSGS